MMAYTAQSMLHAAKGLVQNLDSGLDLWTGLWTEIWTGFRTQTALNNNHFQIQTFWQWTFVHYVS